VVAYEPTVHEKIHCVDAAVRSFRLAVGCLTDDAGFHLIGIESIIAQKVLRRKELKEFFVFHVRIKQTLLLCDDLI
jgi:hypothetical protein